MKSSILINKKLDAAKAAHASELAEFQKASAALAVKCAPLALLLNRRLPILEKMANSKNCLGIYEAENAHFYDHFGAATSAEPAVGNLSDFSSAYHREFIAERIVAAAKYQIQKLNRELAEVEGEIVDMVNKDKDPDFIDLLPLDLKSK